MTEKEKLGRYAVPVLIYVDALNRSDAETIVSDMMRGDEIMAKLWEVQSAELQFTHKD